MRAARACIGRSARAAGITTPSPKAAARALPATVFLGGPPALILSAIAPLPENVPELMLASLIAGRRLSQVHGSGPHPLLADAEFALLGEVPPQLRRPEGPFGDHYGYYSLQHDYPVFQVQRIAHRHDAIFPATVVGKPRQEDFFIGDLLQELLSPLFPLVMPAVEKLWSYGETGYHSLAAAVVKQRYKREAMASAFRILGEGQLSLTKFLLVTDRYVDVKNFRATFEHILARTHVETDLYVFSNLSMDTLDYTGPTVNEGSKGVWLGLGDPVRELPRQFSGTAPSGVTDVRVYCGGCLVVAAPAYASEPDAAARIAASGAFSGLAAGRALRRCGARDAKRHELPVDDVHAVRAGGRHPRRRPAHRAQSHRLHRPDRHRRAHEAVVSEGAVVPRRHRGAGHEALERVLPGGQDRDGRLRARHISTNAHLDDVVSGFSRTEEDRMATMTGAHMIIHSANGDADRAFLRDVLGFPHVDVGQGWLIFALPPSEIAVHPAQKSGVARDLSDGGRR